MQVMVRKDADGASALMLYRKKPEEALQAAEPMFIAAPPAEATTEVCHVIWKLWDTLSHVSERLLCPETHRKWAQALLLLLSSGNGK